MQVDVARVIEAVSKEKGISKEVVVLAIENSMLSAARKQEGPDCRLEAQYNAEIGDVEVFKVWTVVETKEDPHTQLTVEEARERFDPEAQADDEFLDKLDGNFGRIAAQAAKQNLIQRIRDAEREIIYNEFKDRKEEILSGIVTRFERKNMIVQLRPNVDAILPEKEQIPRERYRPQDRIRAYVVDVDLTAKGPQIILSRTHPGFLRKLFEQEVPEIYEGIVEIRGVAREPGGRAKIAVASNNSDVDPVGACVGMKGTRVQSVVQELRGEKIDIVPWTDDVAEFVCRALAPAKVSKIIMDEEGGAMEVVVPDDQLSLAIGRKGQNVRLASRLAGWKLDVASEGEAEEEARQARAALMAIEGMGDVVAEVLLREDFKSAAALVEAGVDTIADVEGVGAERAATIVDAAQARVAEMEREAAAAAQQAEEERAELLTVEPVDELRARKLHSAGLTSIERVARTTPAALTEILSVGEEAAIGIVAAAAAMAGIDLSAAEVPTETPAEGDGEAGAEAAAVVGEENPEA